MVIDTRLRPRDVSRSWRLRRRPTGNGPARGSRFSRIHGPESVIVNRLARILIAEAHEFLNDNR